MPGGNGQKISEGEFQTHTPGNDKYLVNFNVVPLGGATAPSGLNTYENRAFEANVRRSLPYAFSLECRRGACSFSAGSCSQGPRHSRTEPGQTALKARRASLLRQTGFVSQKPSVFTNQRILDLNKVKPGVQSKR